MRRAGLRRRLEKLESKRLAGRPKLRVIHAIADFDPEAMVALEAGSVVVERLPSEPLAVFQARAWEIAGSGFLAARYAASERAEQVETARPFPVAPEAPIAALSDPFALAGIGRTATQAELIGMAAIRVAPERLV